VRLFGPLVALLLALVIPTTASASIVRPPSSGSSYTIYNTYYKSFSYPGCTTYNHCYVTITERTHYNSDTSSSWTYGNTWVQMGGIGWWVKATANFHYNGTRIWVDSPTCDEFQSLIFHVDTTWCGVWNNGGYAPYGFAHLGMNFKVGFLWTGLGSAITHGWRRAIYPSGRLDDAWRW
jgi:hypothetical protein